MNNHSSSNTKDDPLEMSLHDSVISGFCGTKSACVMAGVRRFAKSEVLGMVQRRFLYQTVVLLHRHQMRAITVGSPHFHQSPLCREQSIEQDAEPSFRCMLLSYPHGCGGPRAQADG